MRYLVPPVFKGDVPPHYQEFLGDMVRGLRAGGHILAPKWLYDERGSALFEEICRQPEYYLTRTELGIMQEHGSEIGRTIGAQARLLEFGSGSSLKTRLLLGHLQEPECYIPLDISREYLFRSAAALQRDFPHIPVRPWCADYTRALPPEELETNCGGSGQLTAYFPGSTLGNFTAEQAGEFLEHVHTLVQPGGQLLLGLDLRKDPTLLEAAYNDAAGVSGRFNLNLLARANRELGANFPLELWEHRAVWNDCHSRMEMALVCREPHEVKVGGYRFAFQEGQSLLTEYSHKYSLSAFPGWAALHGFGVRKIWTDDQGWFSVQLLEAF